MKPAFVVFVGLPGSGKSTFITKNPSIKRFVISSDDVRLQFGGVTLQEGYTEGIDQVNDKLVWKTIDAMIETRLKNGITTILDATNTNVERLHNRYYTLAQKYNFRFVIIHFHIDIEESIKRNLERKPYQIVPEFAIRKMYDNLLEFGTPKWADAILNAETIKDFWTAIAEPTPDWSKYSRIYVIGDIQGCSDELNLFLKEADYNNAMFVFLGDLTDRGPKNLETIRTVNELKKKLKHRCILVKGNHDVYSTQYFNDEEVLKEHFSKTKQEYDEANIKQKETADLVKFYHKFCWYQIATFFGNKFFFTHGGIDRVVDNFAFYTGRQYVRGVGERSSCYKCDASFSEDSLKNHEAKAWSFHGHRNPEKNHFLTTPRTYVLESQVEFDGFLSVLEIVPNKNGTDHPFSFTNHKYKM
jgi:predicted kinase/predicted phosphodiesterase